MNILSQRDTRWAEKTLGTKGTIGDFGCTITCIGMAAGLNPDEVNERMKQVNGYADGNLVIWSKIKQAIPWLEFGWRNYTYETPEDNEKVKAAIAKNGFCLVEVDFDGLPNSRDNHWVLFIGDGKMYDPWTGREVLTTKYAIYRGFAIINKVGEAQPPEQSEELKQCLILHDKLMGEIGETKKSLDELQTQYLRLKEDSSNQIRTAEDVAKAQKYKYDDFISSVATRLQTTQDTATIYPEIDRLITVEDLLTKERKAHDATKTELTESMGMNERLKQEIETLKIEKLQALNLGNVSLADYITAKINKYRKWRTE
jgi:hypothetical protein